MEETVTLYVGLKPGEKADFEVVGHAAAAFAEAIKEISYILDPGLDLRLEFDSGTEGSLKLKAIIKSLKSKDGIRASLVTLVGTVGMMLVNDLRGYGTGKLLDQFLGTEQRQQLSEDDINRIAKAVVDIKEGRVAKEPVRRMFKQLERDASIESVGAITKANAKPIDPVPRSEFSARAALELSVETSPRTRTTPSTERLTLIRPVLLDSARPWRFESPLGEMPYRMDDKKFLKDLLEGRSHLEMKSGIQLTVSVETDEQLDGGVWKVILRRIVKVVTVHRKLMEDLFSQPKKRKAASKKKRQAKSPKRRTPK